MTQPNRIVINGFGRIGRTVLRQILTDPAHADITVVAINDIAPLEACAYLFKYDSVFGPFPRKPLMRREYGSDLFLLTDAPLNSDTRLAIIASTARALVSRRGDERRPTPRALRAPAALVRRSCTRSGFELLLARTVSRRVPGMKSMIAASSEARDQEGRVEIWIRAAKALLDQVEGDGFITAHPPI